MKKIKYPYAPLRMPCFHWIGPKPILSFLLKVVKGIFPLFLKHHLHLHWSTKKEFCFDLGSNGYQMNISLTCFAAEGRTTFFYLVIQSWFFWVSLTLSPTAHASKVELEKQEFIISFFFSSCNRWVVCQESLSGILRWHGNAPKVNSF